MKAKFTCKPLKALLAAATALALAACGSESPAPEAGPSADLAQTDPAPETSSLALPEGDVVAAALEGHLEQLTADGVQPFSLAGTKPEFYLLYYTASW